MGRFCTYRDRKEMRKNLLVRTGLFISACLTLAACGGAAGGASGGDAAADVQEAAETAVLGSEGTEGVEQAAEIPVYQAGEAATLGNWQITVTSVEIVDSLSEDNIVYQSNEEGDKLVCATATVTNNAAAEDTFLPSYASAEDVYVQLLCGEDIYFSSKFLGYSQDLHDVTLEPSETKSGKILFEVSGDAANGSGELLLQFLYGSDAVSFKAQ